MQQNKKISYSAVVLDDRSHTELAQGFTAPEGWKVFGHHMTICLGPLPEDWKSRIGEEVHLLITEVGMTDKAFAAKVDNFNRLLPGTPHITLAVNWDGGGRPKDSNAITEWEPFTKVGSRFMVKGTIQEVAFQ